jgi:hypothetical protein
MTATREHNLGQSERAQPELPGRSYFFQSIFGTLLGLILVVSGRKSMVWKLTSGEEQAIWAIALLFNCTNMAINSLFENIGSK